MSDKGVAYSLSPSRGPSRTSGSSGILTNGASHVRVGTDHATRVVVGSAGDCIEEAPK